MGFCALLRTDRFLTVAEERRAVGGGGETWNVPQTDFPSRVWWLGWTKPSRRQFLRRCHRLKWS